MIVYDLHCASGHQFEGWFSHADDYAQQKAEGLLSCPVCESIEVEKLPTASHVRTQLPSLAGRGVAANASGDRQKVLKALNRYVAENFADVGTAFPEEARKIHYGETEARNIRGVTTHDEFKALREEGVEVHALPATPVDKEKLN
jgi:hypothetical protein